MKILWLNWKDRRNPNAGGAETVNEELAKRLVNDGHEVILLTAGFPGTQAVEMIDGYKIVRVGHRWSVYWEAYKYYKKNLQGWPDLVIDEVNTVPFFAKFYVKERNIMFFHMLCRDIWFYEMFFPLNLIGYLAETVYLWLLRDQLVITVSVSTKKDLIRFGFKPENINIISEGIEIEPIKDLDLVKKYEKPTILSLGCIRGMKRTGHIVRAFELAKEKIRDLELVIAGDASSKYGQNILKLIEKSQYKNDIHYLGKVSKQKKIELMQKSHVIAVTSVKEGWGLIVTEANSQGTPALVYSIDGLRDAVKDGETGLITKRNTPQALSDKIVALLQNKDLYTNLQKSAWAWSHDINFDNSYKRFICLLKACI